MGQGFAAIMRLALNALSFILLFGLAVVTRAEDPTEDLDVPIRDRAALFAIVNAAVPAGIPSLRLSAIYKERCGAARQLGLYGKALEIAREWYDAMPPDERTGALYQLHSLNINFGDRALGLKYGEELIRTDQRWSGKFMSRLWVAPNYLDQFELARARALMEEGARYLEQASANPRGNVGQFHLARGRSALARLRARFALLAGKYEDALPLALAAVEHAREAVTRGTNLAKNFLSGAYNQYVGSVGVAAKTYKLLGRNFEGESLIAGAVEYLRQADWLAAYYPALVRMAAVQRMDQHRFADALVLAQRSARASHQESVAAISSNLVHSEQVRLAALIGLGRWNEARQGYRELEAHLTGHPELRKLLSGVQRGVVRLMVGEYEDAARFLGGAYSARKQRMGPAHLFTAQAEGLYGIAAWRMAERAGDAAGAEDGKRLVAESARVLTDADAPQAALSSAGLGEIYRRLILEAHLEALYPAMTAAQQAAVNEGFGIADKLRNSSVQDAIVEAAVRAAAYVPGLGDLVRQVQDGEREMGALYEYLVAPSGEAPDVVDPQLTERLKGRLQTLTRARLQLLQQVRQRFPEFDILTHPRAPKDAAVAKRLHPNEALLSILPTPRRTYLWLVTDGGMSFAAGDATQRQLQDWVARLRKTLDVAGQIPPPAVDTEAAYLLYRSLLAPVRAEAGGRTEWIIVAGGVLAQVPFATLLTRPESAVDYVGAPWLVKDMALSNVPSTAAWMALRQFPSHSRDHDSLIAFGDPDFAGGSRSGAVAKVRNLTVRRPDFPAAAEAVENLPPVPTGGAVRRGEIPPLPETRAEILAVAKTLSADPARDLFFGAQASRRTVLRLNEAGELAKRQVVMFATHGLVPGDLPNLDQPALALAYNERDKEGWLLTLQDVLNLKLDADWVVLSACNTAAADGRSGEALSGLGRGFFYAGARALLVTHWAVETQSAKDLTTGTFAGYGDGNLSRAAALRAAQLALIAKPKTAHPAYWAPFALVGDGAR